MASGSWSGIAVIVNGKQFVTSGSGEELAVEVELAGDSGNWRAVCDFGVELVTSYSWSGVGG